MFMAVIRVDALEAEQENKDMLQSEQSDYRLGDGKQAARGVLNIIVTDDDDTKTDLEEKRSRPPATELQEPRG
jgi:hypothetical protein